MLYANAAPSATGIMVIAGIIWFELIKVLDPWLISGWSVLMIAVAISRLLLKRQYNSSFTTENVQVWARRFLFNTSIAGIGWCMLCLIFLTTEELVYQAAIVLIILGVQGTSVPLLSSYLPAFISSSLPSVIVLPIVVYMRFEETAELLILALILFTSLIYYISIKTNETLKKAVILKYEKQKLVNSLSEEIKEHKKTQTHLEYYQQRLEHIVDKRTAQLEKSNRKLTSEISERKEAEKEKERLQRELQQASKMEALGQLTGGIAHDFNNILGIIMGYTRMALDRYGDDVPEKVVDYLETSMQASNRAKDLIAQMLTFSRRGEVNAKPLQLVPLVKENIKMLQSIIPSSIRIDFNHENNLPSIILEPAKLQQLMMNLCVNARDAMDGSGTLYIDVGWQHGINTECTSCHKRVRGDWIELSVADTGSGMTTETISHIFEPFYTTKDVGEGTGMGMAVVHGIVNAHGGHTLVEAELNKGSTFRLLFPPVTEKLRAIQELAPSPAELAPGAGMHILVLDDEPELAEYIGDLLELHDYQATVITSSQKALNLFQKDPDQFALMITDQTMPELTGVELIKKLREIRPNFPVILCTGYSNDFNTDDAKNMDIRYLGKPIDADRLIQSAGELLGLTPKK